MNILIKETNEVRNLSILDPKTGINYVDDFVANYDVTSDGQFKYDENTDTYICNKSTFDWWHKVLEDNQALENRIHELVGEHSYEAVYDIVHEAGHVDLEDYAVAVNFALDEVYGGEH